MNWFWPLFDEGFGAALSRLVGDPEIPNPLAGPMPADRGGYAESTRRYWSGPSIAERKMLRAFAVTAQQIGVAPRSAFDGRHQQRQRNRRRRRR